MSKKEIDLELKKKVSWGNWVDWGISIAFLVLLAYLLVTFYQCNKPVFVDCDCYTCTELCKSTVYNFVNIT